MHRLLVDRRPERAGAFLEFHIEAARTPVGRLVELGSRKATKDEDSSLEPSESLGLDLFPGYNISGVGCVVGQTTIQFSPLGFGEQRRVWFNGDAFPDRCGQSNTT